MAMPLSLECSAEINMLQMAPNYHPEILLDKSKMSNFELQRKHHTRPIAQLWQLNGKCPKGTIPIRRTKKGDFLRARSILRLPTGRLPRFRFPWRPRTAPVKNSATYEVPQNMSHQKIKNKNSRFWDFSNRKSPTCILR